MIHKIHFFAHNLLPLATLENLVWMNLFPVLSKSAINDAFEKAVHKMLIISSEIIVIEEARLFKRNSSGKETETWNATNHVCCARLFNLSDLILVGFYSGHITVLP